MNAVCDSISNILRIGVLPIFFFFLRFEEILHHFLFLAPESMLYLCDLPSTSSQAISV